MISTFVTVVRPAKADLDILSSGLDILARATRMVFARVYQQRDDAARTKREVCASMGLLAQHYSGCRADAIAAVRGWRERLKEQRVHLRSRLTNLKARREKDYKTPGKRRRNAVATRKAETRLARVEAELQGPPRHCFGGRSASSSGKESSASGAGDVRGMRCPPARRARRTETKSHAGTRRPSALS